MKRTTISRRIGCNRKRQFYQQTLTKIVKNSFFIAISHPTGDNWQSKTRVVAISDPRSSIVRQEFSLSAYPVWKHFFFQQEHEKCKLFLVLLWRCIQ